MKKWILSALLAAAGWLAAAVPMDYDVSGISTEGLTPDFNNCYRVFILILKGDAVDAHRFLRKYSVGNRGFCGGNLFLRSNGGDAPASAYDAVLSRSGNIANYIRICLHWEQPLANGPTISFKTPANASNYTLLTVDTSFWQNGGTGPATAVIMESIPSDGDVLASGTNYMGNLKRAYIEELDTSAWNTAKKLSFTAVGPALTEVPLPPPEWTLRNDGSAAAVVANGPLPSIPAETRGTVAMPATDGALPVTAVGDGALMGCRFLTEITVPETVTAVGSDAFYDCAAMERFPLSDRVTRIGPCAFARCAALTEATLPPALKEIPAGLFYGCGALQRVTLPEGLTAIGDGAFEGCASLREIELPASLKTIGRRAFRGCADTLRVTVRRSSEGTDIAPDAFGPGTAVTLAARPPEGEAFVCWADTGSADPERIFAPGAEHPRAVFMPTDQRDTLTDAVIAGKLADGSLVKQEDIRDMAFGSPVIEVRDSRVTVGIRLQASDSPDGWQPLTPETVSAEDGVLRATFPQKGTERFYRFTVPEGLQ